MSKLADTFITFINSIINYFKLMRPKIKQCAHKMAMFRGGLWISFEVGGVVSWWISFKISYHAFLRTKMVRRF